MSETNNAQALRDWFRGCPALATGVRFRQDYLAEGPTEYAIFSVPSTLSTKENILGQTVLMDIQTENFVFASKEPYGADTRQNLENLAFYQAVMEWIVAQNNAGNFPEWSGGIVKSILPSITASPVQVGAAAAKYQIQIKVTYRRN